MYAKTSSGIHTHAKLLELINEFHKYAGYKVNIQSSIIFLNTRNEQSENEIKKNNFIHNNIIKNKFNRRSVRPVHWKLQNIAERYTMFMDWKPQYC